MQWTRPVGWIVLSVMTACRAPAVPEVREVVPAGRYVRSTFELHFNGDIVQLCLVDQGDGETGGGSIVCDASFDGLEGSVLASARFEEPSNWRGTRGGWTRTEIEPVELPTDLAVDLRRLARMTREVEELGLRIGPRLVDRYALDGGYELTRLKSEWATLGEEQGVDPLLAKIRERIDRWSDGSEPRSALAIRATREELARKSGRSLTSAFEPGTD